VTFPDRVADPRHHPRPALPAYFRGDLAARYRCVLSDRLAVHFADYAEAAQVDRVHYRTFGAGISGGVIGYSRGVSVSVLDCVVVEAFAPLGRRRSGRDFRSGGLGSLPVDRSEHPRSLRWWYRSRPRPEGNSTLRKPTTPGRHSACAFMTPHQPGGDCRCDRLGRSSRSRSRWRVRRRRRGTRSQPGRPHGRCR
jgi:hypothetical protein